MQVQLQYLHLIRQAAAGLSAVILAASCFIVHAAEGDRREHSDNASLSPAECTEAILQQAEQLYLPPREGESITRFTGNYELAASEWLQSHLIVLNGNVIIQGKVSGSVVVLCGDLAVGSQAEISGDAVVIDGKVTRFDGSIVQGDQIEATKAALTPERYRRQKRNRKSEWLDPHRPPPWHAIAHYNRVDVMFIGLEAPQTYHDGVDLDFFGFGGYGISSNRWQYRGGVEFYAGGAFRFAIGSEIHDFTHTEDLWVIPRSENTLAALFLNEDFQDFYRRQGFSAFFSQNLGHPVKLTFSYYQDQHFSLLKRTDWALFGGAKNFRANPEVAEDKLTGYSAALALDTRDHKASPRHGWFLNAELLHGRPELGSNFERLIIDLRRYQPVGYGKNIDIRLRMGTGRGALLPQHWFDLGGLSTLRGYRFKEFTGDRMVLGNLEYRIGAGRSRLNSLPILREFNFILFGDAGLAWEAVDNSRLFASFDSATLHGLKSSAGVAITDRHGRVRLNFARRLDTSEGDIVITVRLNRAF